jgi:inorganic pyrophosphatase
VIIEIPMLSPAVKYEVDKASKDLETNKWVDIKGWEDANAARKEIVEPVERYNALPEKPGYW